MISAKSRALLERMRPTIESASPDEIARAVNANELSPWRDGPLALAHDGSFRAFFAPLDWINDDADIIIVGVTPGADQKTSEQAAVRAGDRLPAGERSDEDHAPGLGALRRQRRADHSPHAHSVDGDAPSVHVGTGQEPVKRRVCVLKQIVAEDGAPGRGRAPVPAIVKYQDADPSAREEVAECEVGPDVARVSMDVHHGRERRVTLTPTTGTGQPGVQTRGAGALDPNILDAGGV